MHQNIAVAEIEIDEEIAFILSIGKVSAPEHIPVGVSFKDGRPYRSDLNDWWHGRSIPASRQNFREAMAKMGISSPGKLLTKCFGLSLSDQYWVNPTANPLDWEKINFFDNPFSEDVGDALFGKKPQGKQLNLASPDNTSDGWLKKKWKIIDGKRCLVKGGSNPFQQEPFNEVYAAAVMRRLNISHVPYSILWEDGLPYSVCENFITRETELVGAYYLHNTKKIENVALLYEHFLDCCSGLGIQNVRENLDKMLTLDYLTANRDRHLSNFGAVRNARTLEWLGLAPVFDSGTSLWNDLLPADFNTAKSKPFFDTHEEQIKLVKDFSWLDLSELNSIDDELREVFANSGFKDEARRDALCIAVRKRAEMLKDIVSSQL
jgi:hypothetical protein